MGSVRVLGLKALTVFLGGLAYLGLNWIPVLGPLAVGFIVGYVRRAGPRDGFRLGVYSGLVGFAGVLVLFKYNSILPFEGSSVFPSFLALWIIVLWNLVGVLFAGVGGALASMFFHAQDFFEQRFPGAGGSVGWRGKAASFIICPNCGSGLREGLGTCPSCGGKV